MFKSKSERKLKKKENARTFFLVILVKKKVEDYLEDEKESGSGKMPTQKVVK